MSLPKWPTSSNSLAEALGVVVQMNRLDPCTSSLEPSLGNDCLFNVSEMLLYFLQ